MCAGYDSTHPLSCTPGVAFTLGSDNTRPTLLSDVHTITIIYFSSVVTQSDGNCPLSDLLSNLSPVNQSDLPLLTLCESNSSFCNITVDEGTVFFNGNRSGSIAFYNASNAYCLNSAPVRVCEDGVWSNEVVFEAGWLYCIMLALYVCTMYICVCMYLLMYVCVLNNVCIYYHTSTCFIRRHTYL